jgi:hypothetical protein
MAGAPSQPFLPGLELARAFFAEAVEPLLAPRFPDLRYGAGLLGHGSDVLGFDDPTSTDHEWGPRADVFLAASEADRAGDVAAALGEELPIAFRGFSTHFAPPDARIRRMAPRAAPPVDHKVEVTTVRAFCADRLGFDVLAGVTVEDWLATPSQSFLEVTAGAIFRDDRGELARLHTALAWYPRDVWLVRMAAQWHRVAQLEAFVGRAGEAGDDLGSRLVTASIVRAWCCSRSSRRAGTRRTPSGSGRRSRGCRRRGRSGRRWPTRWRPPSGASASARSGARTRRWRRATTRSGSRRGSTRRSGRSTGARTVCSWPTGSSTRCTTRSPTSACARPQTLAASIITSTAWTWWSGPRSRAPSRGRSSPTSSAPPPTGIPRVRSRPGSDITCYGGREGVWYGRRAGRTGAPIMPKTLLGPALVALAAPVLLIGATIPAWWLAGVVVLAVMIAWFALT